MPPYITQLLISIDQLFNAIFGGWSDETLSARTWRMREKSYAWKTMFRFINALFFWQNNHCRGAYMSEQVRNQLPPEYRPKSSETSK
jgi:hypothetical protein